MKILFIAFNLSVVGGIQDYNRKFIDAVRTVGGSVATVELRSGSFLSKSAFLLELLWQGLWFRPTITVCTNINYVVLSWLLKRILGNEYVLNVYGVDALNITGRFRRRAVLGAKHIVTPFFGTAHVITEQFPSLAPRIFLVPNSVDGRKFGIEEKPRRLITKHGLSGKSVILTVARLSTLEKKKTSKGYDRVIKALPAITKAIPNAVYILVGGGDDLPNVKKLINTLNMGNAVILPGAVSDDELIDYFHVCDVFTLPSKGEGFPAIVLLEALACGKPVVCGRQADTASTLFGREFGIVVDGDSVSEIADAITKVLSGNVPKKLSDPEMLRASVLAEYGFERVVERVRELFARST